MKISSLSKFLCEDLFFCLSIFLSFFLVISKFSKSLFLFIAFIVSILIWVIIFFLAFKNLKFFKRNLSRFLSCFLLVAYAIISNLAPFLLKQVEEFEKDSITVYSAINRTKFLNVLRGENELIVSLFINAVLFSFIAASRIISIIRINKTYKVLKYDILEYKDKKPVLNPFLYILPFVFCFFVSFFFKDYRQYYTLSFIFALIFASFAIYIISRNPITFREEKRLDIYLREKNRSDSLDFLQERYKERIINRWVKNYKLPFASETIMGLSRFIFGMKVNGIENIINEELPSVFVSNHGEIIGPVCGTSYLSTVYRPYVHDHMCDVEKSAFRMWKYTFSKPLAFMGEKRSKRFSHFIARITTHLINSFEPIHSYVGENDPRKSMQSMHDGLDCILSGDSLLIFPENPGKTENHKYEEGKTGELYTGFAHIGKLFNDKTGRNLHFYPMFINKKKKTITIDKPVVFNNTENTVQEKRRVAKAIYDAMNSNV